MEIEMLSILFLVFACAVVNGDSNLTESVTSPAVAECPVPVNWGGLDASTCSQQQCKDNKDCNSNGVQGFCCETSCSGRNCWYNTSLARPKRWAKECPPQWQGTNCNQNMCSTDQQCSQHGTKGHCCPTKCGKTNCHTMS